MGFVCAGLIVMFLGWVGLIASGFGFMMLLLACTRFAVRSCLLLVRFGDCGRCWVLL